MCCAPRKKSIRTPISSLIILLFLFSGKENEILFFEEVGGSPEGVAFKTVTMGEL